MPADCGPLCEIHDAARRDELEASGLVATILVAEQSAQVLGFAAYTEEELTWLYVDPRRYRQGVGRRLVRAVVQASKRPLSLDVLVGNEAALALYLSEGFSGVKQVSGKLAGNERFPATAHVLRYVTPSPATPPPAPPSPTPARRRTPR